MNAEKEAGKEKLKDNRVRRKPTRNPPNRQKVTADIRPLKKGAYTLSPSEIVELASLMSEHRVLNFYAHIQRESTLHEDIAKTGTPCCLVS